MEWLLGPTGMAECCRWSRESEKLRKVSKGLGSPVLLLRSWVTSGVVLHCWCRIAGSQTVSRLRMCQEFRNEGSLLEHPVREPQDVQCQPVMSRPCLWERDKNKAVGPNVTLPGQYGSWVAGYCCYSSTKEIHSCKNSTQCAMSSAKKITVFSPYTLHSAQHSITFQTLLLGKHRNNCWANQSTPISNDREWSAHLLAAVTHTCQIDWNANTDV